MNVNMSFFKFVEVKVGATPPDHFIAAGHVTARAVPSAVNSKLKPIDLFDVAGVLEIVKVVIGEFNETVNI
jgi:hypothetical protein